MSELTVRWPSGTSNVPGWGLWPSAWMFWVCGRVAWSADAGSAIPNTRAKAAMRLNTVQRIGDRRVRGPTPPTSLWVNDKAVDAGVRAGHAQAQARTTWRAGRPRGQRSGARWCLVAQASALPAESSPSFASSRYVPALLRPLQDPQAGVHVACVHEPGRGLVGDTPDLRGVGERVALRRLDRVLRGRRHEVGDLGRVAWVVGADHADAVGVPGQVDVGADHQRVVDHVVARAGVGQAERVRCVELADLTGWAGSDSSRARMDSEPGTVPVPKLVLQKSSSAVNSSLRWSS